MAFSMTPAWWNLYGAFQLLEGSIETTSRYIAHEIVRELLVL